MTSVKCTLRKKQVIEILGESKAGGPSLSGEGGEEILCTGRGGGERRDTGSDSMTRPAGSHREEGNNCSILTTERQNSVPFPLLMVTGLCKAEMRVLLQQMIPHVDFLQQS